ncbi:DUF2461 domain-containing protein [Flavobacterium agricola]|uniref:DUF2461 domain-containing protein n=1 Tax=Flavobacterium agricola TaxID=2870839 RepID=A0ABY6M1A6_9FLAO|nr:DUF2461 domain-containing protein [Flavobacterium agricola]UYW02344.1 DUF2461 domain-containing protein [Flavobacterium agricola]
MEQLTPGNLNILKAIAQNNNREWFTEHKPEIDVEFDQVKNFFKSLYAEMEKHDQLEPIHIHRLYRDARFSKNKLPYKDYFGLHIPRQKPYLRGGYFLRIKPGGCRVAGGFYGPEPNDLKRIREEIALDPDEFRSFFTTPEFKKLYDGLESEELKTAPKGYPKDHPAIDLLKKKSFIIYKDFTDAEVLSPDFYNKVIACFLGFRPFFDYMSAVLTTNSNGENIF